MPRIDATFRITGKAPRTWFAETGKSEPASYAIANGRTTVPLNLEPWGTVFVVFRKPATAPARTLPPTVETPLTTLDGPWDLAFQPNRGVPASITLDTLASWTTRPRREVLLRHWCLHQNRLLQPTGSNPTHPWLDLGDVKNLAQVFVNGTSLGVAWNAPYRVDVTKVLKPGKNVVTIKVINAWVNRMIGDQQPNAGTITFTDVAPYSESRAGR